MILNVHHNETFELDILESTLIVQKLLKAKLMHRNSRLYLIDFCLLYNRLSSFEKNKFI
jgi:hypothetical protein